MNEKDKKILDKFIRISPTLTREINKEELERCYKDLKEIKEAVIESSKTYDFVSMCYAHILRQLELYKNSEGIKLMHAKILMLFEANPKHFMSIDPFQDFKFVFQENTNFKNMFCSMLIEAIQNGQELQGGKPPFFNRLLELVSEYPELICQLKDTEKLPIAIELFKSNSNLAMGRYADEFFTGILTICPFRKYSLLDTIGIVFKRICLRDNYSPISCNISETICHNVLLTLSVLLENNAELAKLAIAKEKVIDCLEQLAKYNLYAESDQINEANFLQGILCALIEKNSEILTDKKVVEFLKKIPYLIATDLEKKIYKLVVEKLLQFKLQKEAYSNWMAVRAAMRENNPDIEQQIKKELAKNTRPKQLTDGQSESSKRLDLTLRQERLRFKPSDVKIKPPSVNMGCCGY